jgi:hypothetical protein
MARATLFNPIVLQSKTVFLQRVQEAVIAGYRYYVLGTISLGKALNVIRKFKELYYVDLDKNARYCRKAAGLGNARLYLRLNDEQSLDFALLISPGEHPAHQLEKLTDIRKKPLAYREFELVLLTLKGREKPGLTWRLNGVTIDAWRQRLHLYTTHYNRLELFRAWYSLYRVPGFAGVRRQVGELVSHWRAEWRRHRRQDPCPIAFPHNDTQYRARPGVQKGEDGMYWTTKGFPTSAQLPKLFYVRKQPNLGRPLRSLLRELAADQRAHLSSVSSAETSFGVNASERAISDATVPP